jgi:hypothetical protein
MKLDITQIYLADILESALLDLDIQLTPAEWKIIQDHTARLEQALKEEAAE